MERIISGYCRTQDQARTIMVEFEDGQWDFACDFPDCAFAANCSLAKEIRELLREYNQEGSV